MKKIIAVSSALILIVFSYGIATAGQPTSNVIVVNPQSNPVPVAGTVSISGTPNVNTSNGPTTVLASASDFVVNTGTEVVSGIDVSHCDRVRININVLQGSDSVRCFIYDPLTSVPLDATSDLFYRWTSVLEPLTQSISVQCSAVIAQGVPGTAHVSYALYCR